MAGKRGRDIATPDTRLIEIYEDLANENEEIRLRAAHTLLSEFAQPTSISHQKIKAILQRLFRGLCSSRKAARLGFSIALTEFLAQIFQYPVEETGLAHDHLLPILEKQTLVEGSTSGQVGSIQTETGHDVNRPRMSETTTLAGFLVLRPSSNLVSSSSRNHLCKSGRTCCS